MAYIGSVEIASGLIGINGRNIPLIHESSIQIGDSSNDRLDVLIDSMQENIANSLKVTGGVMKGSLLLECTPTKDNEVVDKQYVDNAVKNFTGSGTTAIDENELNEMLQEVLGL